MKKLTPEECKLRILNLLVEFADYCDTNNLRYYLAGRYIAGGGKAQGLYSLG